MKACEPTQFFSASCITVGPILKDGVKKTIIIQINVCQRIYILFSINPLTPFRVTSMKKKPSASECWSGRKSKFKTLTKEANGTVYTQQKK